MRAVIIIYEFNNLLINNRKALEQRIIQYRQYAFLTSNSCLIFTDATVVSVRDYLWAAMSSGDKIYVGETSAPAAWNNLHNDVSEYLKQNLK
jgi:hypothetical protein